jgi:hypothetical protein
MMKKRKIQLSLRVSLPDGTLLGVCKASLLQINVRTI